MQYLLFKTNIIKRKNNLIQQLKKEIIVWLIKKLKVTV